VSKRGKLQVGVTEKSNGRQVGEKGDCICKICRKGGFTLEGNRDRGGQECEAGAGAKKNRKHKKRFVDCFLWGSSVGGNAVQAWCVWGKWGGGGGGGTGKRKRVYLGGEKKEMTGCGDVNRWTRKIETETGEYEASVDTKRPRERNRNEMGHVGRLATMEGGDRKRGEQVRAEEGRDCRIVKKRQPVFQSLSTRPGEELFPVKTLSSRTLAVGNGSRRRRDFNTRKRACWQFTMKKTSGGA